jgi:hypothetical protein
MGRPRAMIPDEHGGYQPPTAQHASREGKVLAHNIVANSRGKDLIPFTGASRGIGDAIVQELPRRGACVVGVARNRGAASAPQTQAVLRKLPLPDRYFLTDGHNHNCPLCPLAAGRRRSASAVMLPNAACR